MGNKNRKGIWISEEILNDKNLDAANKIILAEIYSLCKLSKPKEYIKMLPRNPTPYQIEHNKEKAKELMAKVVLKPTDPKAWAKRILERQAKGEYRFELGVKFAREALRVK